MGCTIVTDLGPVEYPSSEHRLQHPYCLWFSKRPTMVRNIQVQGTQGYSQGLRLVGQVGTVEQWWSLYSHLQRLQELAPHTDLHLFKKGIQPMWEDSANSKGGKWVIRLRKGQVGRAWENLCMAMLGEQFMVIAHPTLLNPLTLCIYSFRPVTKYAALSFRCDIRKIY